jgi:hypothetical protein
MRPARAEAEHRDREAGDGGQQRQRVDERPQPVVCLLGARDHHQARGVPIEPVDDARTLGIAACGAPGERLDERS